MSSLRSVEIYDIIDSPYAIHSDDGVRVADYVDSLLQEKKTDSISISFLHIDLLSLSFLNAFFIRLSDSYQAEFLQGVLQLKYASKSHFALFSERLKAAVMEELVR